MAAQSLETSSILQIWKSDLNLVKHSIKLSIIILGFNILYRNILVNYIPLLAIVTLLLIPIFSYLFQRSVLLKQSNSKTWFSVLHAIIMITMAAFLLAIFEYLAAIFQFEWYFLKGKDLSRITNDFLNLSWSYVYWYLLVGIPGSFLARFILYLQLK